jgi:protein-tyrosine phosphatase
MIAFTDLHVHLLAGLDDGPRTSEDAVAMCRLAAAEGVRAMAATAHQNERWPVTPAAIRCATAGLQAALRREKIPVTVFPNAEVTAQDDTALAWRSGKLLTVGDRGHYLLVEMPRGTFVDLAPLAETMRRGGVRVILAHPEKEPELLHCEERMEALLDAGCLVQVSSASITDPKSPADLAALKRWFERGIVHLLASDGHSPRRRPPRMMAAYREICRWVGPLAADRIAGLNGMAILSGRRLRVRPPLRLQRTGSWFGRWW